MRWSVSVALDWFVSILPHGMPCDLHDCVCNRIPNGVGLEQSCNVCIKVLFVGG